MKNSTPLVLLCILLLFTGCGDQRLASSGANPGGSQDAGFFRASLRNGMVPLRDSITVEGFLSEHSIASPQSECGQILCLSGSIIHDHSVAEGQRATLIHLGMNSEIDLSERPRMPLNLAVVIDVSGSMNEYNKLSYVQDGLRLMLEQLKPTDRLAIITYSNTAQVLVPSQLVEHKEIFSDAINNLRPGGSTNLHSGMMLGYEQVSEYHQTNVLSRVMLLSDGLATTGQTDPEQIQADSKSYNDQGIGLTTIGVGMDFNQDLMRSLSEQGGGNFYFIEDPRKAETVFEDELDFLVTPIAKNLQITLRLAPGFSHINTYGLPRSWNDSNELVVEVPTVFASKKSGAILIRIGYGAEMETYIEQQVLEMDYSYEPIAADGTIEEPAQLANEITLSQQLSEESRIYDGHGSLKAMVVWNMVTTFQAASDAYTRGDAEAALELIESLALYVDEANLLLDDDEIRRDRIELINRFAQNLGGWIGESHYCDESYDHSCDMYYDHHHGGFMFGCNSSGENFPSWGVLGLLLMIASGLRRRAQEH